MEIHELPGGTLADADVLAVDNGTSTRKLNFKNIANSLITAITNPISTLIGNTEMGTTATTITGAIAEHESDISTLNSNESFICTAGTSQFTINRQRCFRNGKRVVISFDATANSNITTGTNITILQIPTTHQPSTDLTGLGWIWTGTTLFSSMIKVTKSGNYYYIMQNASNTISVDTRIVVYCEYFVA